MSNLSSLLKWVNKDSKYFSCIILLLSTARNSGTTHGVQQFSQNFLSVYRTALKQYMLINIQIQLEHQRTRLMYYVQKKYKKQNTSPLRKAREENADDSTGLPLLKSSSIIY